MRPPLKQTCPKCDHTFPTKMGITREDINKMREKVLAYDFTEGLAELEKAEAKVEKIKTDNSRWGRFRRWYMGIK